MPRESALALPKLLHTLKTILGALALMAAGSVASASERLYIFTENYPPYNASASGKGFAHGEEDITGICSDMVKAMLARVDYDYVMKMRAWSYAYDWVQDRENHGLFCTARTDEREDLFQWVGPLASIKWTCLRRRIRTCR
ncbi:hypothetical protein [Marinobacter similis]|uniref:hypothetical protein n=1 Tax=Marinobacter similis TaxID=1420916 RepID=UPI000A40B575|nr:hypothetical protein [Marinobacter similis]